MHHTIGLDQETKDILRAMVDKVGVVLDSPAEPTPWRIYAPMEKAEQDAWLDDRTQQILWLRVSQAPPRPGFSRLCLVKEDY